jgi:hypothetical protein
MCIAIACLVQLPENSSVIFRNGQDLVQLSYLIRDA